MRVYGRQALPATNDNVYRIFGISILLKNDFYFVRNFINFINSACGKFGPANSYFHDHFCQFSNKVLKFFGSIIFELIWLNQVECLSTIKAKFVFFFSIQH